jgi:hypothetical protein
MANIILPLKSKDTGLQQNLEYELTSNKFIALKNGKPFINLAAVEELLLRLPSPVVKQGNHKQLATKLFLYDRAWGLEFFTSKLDLSIEISEDDLENFILQSVSLYLFKETNKFPLKKDEDVEVDSKDIASRDDNPDDIEDTSERLKELDLTPKDFKI